MLLFSTQLYKLNIITKRRSKSVKKRHDLKLSKLRRKNDCSFLYVVSMVKIRRLVFAVSNLIFK